MDGEVLQGTPFGPHGYTREVVISRTRSSIKLWEKTGGRRDMTDACLSRRTTMITAYEA